MLQDLPERIRSHIELYLREPEKGHWWDASQVGWKGLLPTLLLITTGCKTGQRRMIPLIYGKTKNAFIIVASKGGSASDPAWLINLKANPDCQVQVAADRFSVSARIATGEERTKLWEQMIDLYPPYIEYQKTAGAREIPVVVLEKS